MPADGAGDCGVHCVPIYRLYLLNPQRGHIDGYEELSSADDVGAICLAHERRSTGPAELWLGSRKIVHIDAAPDRATRSLEPAHATVDD